MHLLRLIGECAHGICDIGGVAVHDGASPVDGPASLTPAAAGAQR